MLMQCNGIFATIFLSKQSRGCFFSKLHFSTTAICKAAVWFSVAKTALECKHCQIISIFHAEVMLGLEQVLL
jgi:hypothetical protein